MVFSLNLSSIADVCQRSDEQNTAVSNRIYEPSLPTGLAALHQQRSSVCLDDLNQLVGKLRDNKIE